MCDFSLTEINHRAADSAGQDQTACRCKLILFYTVTLQK